MIGGLPTKLLVQLAGINLIGPQEYSIQKINELCPVGSFVILQVPGAQLEPDALPQRRQHAYPHHQLIKPPM